MNDVRRTLNALAERFLKRALLPTDALAPDLIASAERRLDIVLPESLRTYYSMAGECRDFNVVHNYLVPPSELGLDDDYLVFMQENQSVVSWGFRVSDLKQADPIVWQRNNTENVWYSEEKPLAPFLETMFEFYAHIGVWSGDP